MKSAGPGLSVLLLTEDGGAQADEVLRSLVVKLLGHIEPGAVTREHARAWEPASPEARGVARANGWKDPRRRDLVSFRQYIASKLQREHGFVFFHVDGDRPYRERATSENTRKFETMIRRPVRIILEGPLPHRRRRGEPSVPHHSAEVERRLAKLIILVPHYSIEAWLFQNTEHAARHCPGEPSCRHGCAEKLSAWSHDRALLDELPRPKDELCFGDAHNAELAGAGYPLDEVLSAEKSLHDALQALRSCSELAQALQHAMPSWKR